MVLEVLSNPELHIRASKGYEQTGESVDLFSGQDNLICKEEGEFWNEQTQDGYPNMRAKIDVELAAVAEEFESGALTWCRRDV